MPIVLCVSILMIFSGVIYQKLETHSITEPFLALLFGIIVGPDVLNVITSASPETEFEILKIACEFTIAVALMATAFRLPHDLFRKHRVSLSNLSIFGMLLMCLFSAGVLKFLLPGFTLAECLLIGAIITPTDPVVASTLTTGKPARKYLPKIIRNSLTFEAGVNDGLVYPLVFLGLFLMGAADFTLQEWGLKILLYENILCAILAYLVGHGAGFIMKKAHKAGWMNQKTLLSFSLAVTLLLLSLFNILKMNGIIAVFVGGYAFAKDLTRNEDIQEEKIQESMERMTTIPVFFILGLMLPWQDWWYMGWKAIAIVLGILFFRRIPALLLIMPAMPDFRKKFYSIMMMGWFGPIGVATLYYAIEMQEKASFEEAWILPSLIVVASTVVHGFTSVPLEKLYHRYGTRANEFHVNKDFEQEEEDEEEE